MKNIYQKPTFKFITLDATSKPAACAYEMDYSWQICGITIMDGVVVFTDENICTYGPDDGFSVCQHNGAANNSVFGS